MISLFITNLKADNEKLLAQARVEREAILREGLLTILVAVLRVSRARCTRNARSFKTTCAVWLKVDADPVVLAELL